MATRRPLGEISTRAGNVDQVIAADPRLVAVERGVFKVFYVQRDAVADDDHQDHAAEARQRQADRITAKLLQFAIAVCEHSLETKAGAQTGGLRAEVRSRLDGSFRFSLFCLTSHF